MKKLSSILMSLVLALMFAATTSATLVTIGTAQFGGAGTEYNLIWDDDNNGNSVVWLDYTNSLINWSSQNAWAAGLNISLTYNIFSAYSINWGGSSWRLSAMIDGPWVPGYEGDPDNDGVYSYTDGCNLANSEMGHLFYTELLNLGVRDTDGTYPSVYGLQNVGDFENLTPSRFWSGTEYATLSGRYWYFDMGSGMQSYDHFYNFGGGLAIRNCDVSAVPLPGAVWFLGAGLIGIIGIRRKKG